MKRIVFVLFVIAFNSALFAQDSGIIPTQDFIKRDADPKKVTTTIEILVALTVLTLAPSILVMVTSFTRIVIVLSFVRRALATQELPPNPVIIGLSLIISFMVMAPTVRAIKHDAINPYTSEDPKLQIGQKEALSRSVGHLRTFMFKQTRLKDLRLFLDIEKANGSLPKEVTTEEEVPTEVLIPAFAISELRRAFIMGFIIFLPFMIIDIVVSTTLISMGMLVLPPILISLPFKILLFILVDGWHLIVGSLVQSFNM
ncbi:flagellar type III secretion system pore protein FliP [Candidatus Peregrinibacteria bacterium]|nr:flagellar type III secretion system pore protein FliP [Candidatus Peregrinibacteria bacterium]